MAGAPDDALGAALGRQQERGLLGPAPLATHRAHSRAFASALGVVPTRAVDLGSGGGVPGLVLAAECWAATEVVLLDASQRRCTLLEVEVAAVGLSDRVRVVWARAEEAGRDPGLRGWADAVVARSFGAPAVTAEAAAPLLTVGGALVVSDPPDGGARWDAPALGALGLVLERSVRVEGASFSVLRQVEACPDRFPRRPGVAARRPLFGP